MNFFLIFHSWINFRSMRFWFNLFDYLRIASDNFAIFARFLRWWFIWSDRAKNAWPRRSSLKANCFGFASGRWCKNFQLSFDRNRRYFWYGRLYNENSSKTNRPVQNSGNIKNNYQSVLQQNFWQNIWLVLRRIFNVKLKMLSDLMLILIFLPKWMVFRPSVVVMSLNLFRLTRLHFHRLLKRHYFRELNSPNFMHQIQGFWKKKVISESYYTKPNLV